MYMNFVIMIVVNEPRADVMPFFQWMQYMRYRSVSSFALYPIRHFPSISTWIYIRSIHGHLCRMMMQMQPPYSFYVYFSLPLHIFPSRPTYMELYSSSSSRPTGIYEMMKTYFLYRRLHPLQGLYLHTLQVPWIAHRVPENDDASNSGVCDIHLHSISLHGHVDSYIGPLQSVALLYQIHSISGLLWVFYNSIPIDERHETSANNKYMGLLFLLSMYSAREMYHCWYAHLHRWYVARRMSSSRLHQIRNRTLNRNRYPLLVFEWYDVWWQMVNTCKIYNVFLDCFRRLPCLNTWSKSGYLAWFVSINLYYVYA